MKRFQKTIATFLIALIALPTFALSFPRPAHAFLLVHDPIAFESLFQIRAKEAGVAGGIMSLDGIAWIVAKAAVQSLVRSTVNWINSGFQGSPAFTTDLNRNLLRVGDALANKFINELVDGLVDSPYQDEVSEAVRLTYFLSTGEGNYFNLNPYTLSQVSEDPLQFLNEGDFARGGFNAWFSALDYQNNPYGSYELAIGELNNRLRSGQGARRSEIGWGNGFLSWRSCDQLSSTGTITDITTAPNVDFESGTVTPGETTSVALADTDNCTSSSIKTPGSVIKQQLDNHLNSSLSSLITADEINEIIGALFQQLMNRVLGFDGLIGVSQPSDGGGRSFLDQATDPSQYNQPGTGGTAPTGTAGTGGTGTGAAVGTAFVETVTNQAVQVEAYRTAWTQIGAAADAALARCPNSDLPQSAKSQSTSALAKAATAITALGTIQSQAVSILQGADQTGNLVALSDSYSALQTSGTLPSQSELIQATTEAQDAPDSLLRELNEISTAARCPG